jgi:hypothetical protein
MATKAPPKTPLLDRLGELDEKLAEAQEEARKRRAELDEHRAALVELRRMDRSAPDDEEALPLEVTGTVAVQRATRALERARAAVGEVNEEITGHVTANMAALVAELGLGEEAEVAAVHERIAELAEALAPLGERWRKVQALYSRVGWAGRSPDEPFGELRRVIDGAGRAQQGIHITTDDGTREFQP